MATLDFNGRPLELNEHDFLAHPDEWSPEVARLLARETEGVDELGPDHWKLIEFIRDFYGEHGLAPMIRVLCKRTRLKLKYVYELFPSGPALGACKVAGLPNADGCI